MPTLLRSVVEYTKKRIPFYSEGVNVYDGRALSDYMGTTHFALTKTDFLRGIGIFLLIFITAKAGQYVFYEWDTSPVVLWPPSGIAVALMWLYGYRFAFPIFIGLVLSAMTGPLGFTLTSLISASGQILGNVGVVYALRKLGFDGLFSNSSSLFIAVVVIIFGAMIAPSVNALGTSLFNGISIDVHDVWFRGWSGHLLSYLILFPLLVSWMHPGEIIPKRSIWELSIAALLVVASVYLLIWRSGDTESVVIAFALFFVVHFWIGFRFSTRALTLSLAATTVFGIVGLFLSPTPGIHLHDQLFAAELFLFLVIPILYTMSSLVKERARTIEKLKDAMENIERESRAKNEFIAVLAHELRNPLAPIKSTLEIVGLSNIDSETKLIVTRAQQQVRTMQRLLSDLLDIGRVTQGNFQLKKSEVQICELIRQCILSTQYVFKDREHTITMDPVCDESLWLMVDPIRFEQLLVNVFMNAAKYTDPGGKINVSVRSTGGSVEIRVKDNGIGIDPEHLEDVFEPFWQFKKNDVKSLSGIGVGLWLTRRIVEMHEGTIHAESEGKGKGSTFVIRVPNRQVKRPREIETQILTPALLHRRVLIGDDNKAAADSLAKLLSLKDYNTRAVYSGGEVLQVVPTFSPDIIVLDIGLIDMSGYDVARALRNNGYRGHIVALSGYGQEEDKRKSRESGFDHHFIKPMALEQFEEYLRNVESQDLSEKREPSPLPHS